MGDHAEFKDHIEMQEYAERSGLDYTWAGTKLFAKRERTLPSDQFEVRPVQTKRGITMVGLFSAAITRAEREADAPYREAMAAKRLARVTRAERRMPRSMAPKGPTGVLAASRTPARGRPPAARGLRTPDTALRRAPHGKGGSWREVHAVHSKVRFRCKKADTRALS